jgi:hypothetical protein
MGTADQNYKLKGKVEETDGRRKRGINIIGCVKLIFLWPIAHILSPAIVTLTKRFFKAYIM